MAKKSKDEREYTAAEIDPLEPIPAPQPAAATAPSYANPAYSPPPPPPPDEAQQKADELAVLGKMTPRERAFFAFGLEERHVLAAKEYPQPDGSVEVAILTQGGQRLRWPRDEGRVLSDMEKGDAVPHAVPAGIFQKR